MKCDFQVGDKVALIHEVVSAPPHGEQLPEIGQVYTVRDVTPYINGIGIRLVEIVNAPAEFIDGFVEISFAAEKFRRVIKTDISELQEIARKAFDGERELLPIGVIR